MERKKRQVIKRVNNPISYTWLQVLDRAFGDARGEIVDNDATTTGKRAFLIQLARRWLTTRSFDLWMVCHLASADYELILESANKEFSNDQGKTQEARKASRAGRLPRA